MPYTLNNGALRPQRIQIRHYGHLRRGLAALLCAALVAPSAFAGEPPGAATPEALVARMNAAVAADDFAEVAACIAPDERAQLAVAMVAMTGMMIGFMSMGGDMASGMAEGMAEGMTGEEMSAEQKAQMGEMEKGKSEMAAKMAAMEKSYNGILDRYGLADKLAEGGPEPPEGTDPAVAARQLLAGVDDIALLRDLFKLMGEVGDGGPKPTALAMSNAETVDLKVEGDHGTARRGEETVELARIDGRWYFKPAMGPSE